MTMRMYQPRTPLQAIDPQAFFMLFAEPEAPENQQRDGATIVTIRGPLSQHDDHWEDSYEAILARVAEACEQPAPVVVLRIDSPGGDVAGCFDAALAIRAMCERAQKRLVVHTDGQCCSAAYALATAADEIWASRTAQVGSIGVIAARVDQSRMMENEGVKVTLIASGRRKTDGAPYSPMSDDERASHQADIDALADEFFSLVCLHRPWMNPDSIKALEAASYRGSAATAAGLVDELGSFDDVIASLSAAPEGTNNMNEEEIRSALAAAAEDEDRDEEARARARRALAAMDEEPADDEPADDDGDESDEDSSQGGGDEDDEQAAHSAGTVSASTAGDIAAHGSDMERRLAKLEARTEAADRKRLIAEHGGVPAGMAKLLASKPLGEVKALLAELPKPRKPQLGDHAATTTVAGTRGDGQDNASRLPPADAKAMRRAMGIEKETFGVVQRGNVLQLGAPVPAEGGE